MPRSRSRRRGPNRCSWCLTIGHDLRNCGKAKAEGRKRRREHGGHNRDYQANRSAKLCDGCGARSETTYCARCTRKRKLQPSRQSEYVKATRGDRYLYELKYNAARNAARGVTLDRDVELYRIAKQQAIESDEYEQEIRAHTAWMASETKSDGITRLHALRSLLELGIAASKRLRRRKK